MGYYVYQKNYNQEFQTFPVGQGFWNWQHKYTRRHKWGSGLNVFVGEDGSGKTALLDAFALPILEYKTENFGVDNFNDTSKKIEINIYSDEEFEVDGTMPKGSFKANGFSFEAGVRSKESKTYLSSIIVNDQNL